VELSGFSGQPEVLVRDLDSGNMVPASQVGESPPPKGSEQHCAALDALPTQPSLLLSPDSVPRTIFHHCPLTQPHGMPRNA